MNSVRRFVVLLALGLAAQPCEAQDFRWFESAPSRCSGPTSAPDVVRALGLQQSPSLTASTTGHLYAVIGPGGLFDGAVLGKPFVDSMVIFDAAKAQSLRGYLERQADGFEVPLLIDLAMGKVADIATPSTGGLVGASIYQLLRQSQSSASLELRLAAQLVAQGGKLERVIAPTLRDNKPYVILLVRYTVKLGDEHRAVVIHACEMPVKIRVEEFLTADVQNNKSIRRTSDASYAQFDIEEPHKDHDLRVVGQDEEFYYFTEASAGDRIRISYRGGPMQVEREGAWRTWYRAVRVK